MKYDFTKEEKNIIAEFVYSYGQDILIVTDATELVNVLAKHKIIENPDEWHHNIQTKKDGIARELLLLLNKHIPEEQGTAIMNEYFKG